MVGGTGQLGPGKVQGEQRDCSKRQSLKRVKRFYVISILESSVERESAPGGRAHNEKLSLEVA